MPGERELSGSPGMLPLLARAAAALVPGASRLPFVAGGGGETPDYTLRLAAVAIDEERRAAYTRLCGFSLRDELPPTYPHVLAFPLALALMTDGSFPFPAVGLVHISNSITQHRPLRSSERLSLSVRASRLEPHPRGRTFSLISEARVADELVWVQESVNLRRGDGTGSPLERAPRADLPMVAQWKLPGDLGRRYASVSGDRNPIHLHALSARAFGFPAAIAHGMWTQARCLAALGPTLPEEFTVEVSFLKPILLPATVAFGAAPSNGGVRFGVRDAGQGTPHLTGEVSFR